MYLDHNWPPVFFRKFEIRHSILYPALMDRRDFIKAMSGVGAAAVLAGVGAPVLARCAVRAGVAGKRLKYGDVLLVGWSDPGVQGGEIYRLKLDDGAVEARPVDFNMLHSVCPIGIHPRSLVLVEQYGRNLVEISAESLSVVRKFQLPPGKLFNGHAVYHAKNESLLLSAMVDSGGSVRGAVLEMDFAGWSVKRVLDLGVPRLIPHDILLTENDKVFLTARTQDLKEGAVIGEVILFDLAVGKVSRRWDYAKESAYPSHFGHSLSQGSPFFSVEKMAPGLKYDIAPGMDAWTDDYFKQATRSAKYLPSTFGMIDKNLGGRAKIMPFDPHDHTFVRPFNLFGIDDPKLSRYIVVNYLDAASVKVWDLKTKKYVSSKRLAEKGKASACPCGSSAIFCITSSGEALVLSIPELKVLRHHKVNALVAPHPFPMPVTPA